MKPHRMNICVDFDGVIHDYTEGYKDGSLYGKPLKGSIESLIELFNKGYEIVILTTRDSKQHNEIELWIRSFLPEKYEKIPMEVTNIKPPAGAYVDDKAIAFRNWEQSMKDIINQIEKERKRPN